MASSKNQWRGSRLCRLVNGLLISQLSRNNLCVAGVHVNIVSLGRIEIYVFLSRSGVKKNAQKRGRDGETDLNSAFLHHNDVLALRPLGSLLPMEC